MKESGIILKQQSTRLFFKNGGTDSFFNWLLGIDEVFDFSHRKLCYFAQRLGKSPKPSTWKKVFPPHTDYLTQRLDNPNLTKQSKAQYYLAQTYSIRLAIQFINPLSEGYLPIVRRMKESPRKAIYSLKAPIEELTIRYRESYLPGYYLHSGDDCPTLTMIDGRDTYREDLFYFAGYPGWKRGYSVLMIDFPGQGSNPSRELTFDMNAATPVSLCIDWSENKNPKSNHLAIYGVSGGGYSTTQAVKQDTRIRAWVASTPIYDIAEILKEEFGFSLKTPSQLMNAILRPVGDLNESADLNLQKYAQRFGTTNFERTIGEVFKRAEVVNCQKVRCPCLFIMGKGGGAELQCRAKVVYETVKSRDSYTRLQISEAEGGADVHCRISDLGLVHNVAFDWLNALFE